jgi:hypothetical protein
MHEIRPKKMGVQHMDSVDIGYGDGYDNGYGKDYGNGYGNGDGYDNGNGYGNGNGDGNGYDNGNGYGNGNGDGNDNGYDNGNGNSYDIGNGIGNSTLKLQGAIMAYHVMPRHPKQHGGVYYQAEVGLVLSHDLPLIMCSVGLHASLTVEQAKRYQPHGTLCRVECSGHIIFSRDKLICETRRIVDIIGEV